MKEDKKVCNGHGLVMWIIVALLSFILIILVFKIGIMVGRTRSSFSSYKTGHFQKSIGEYHAGLKKTEYKAFKLKAEEKGMTMEEYKAYLTEQKSNQ